MNQKPGRRIFPGETGALAFQEGDYGFSPSSKEWLARPPGCSVGSLAAHDVTEHEDGTITVSPSILITWGDAAGDHQWHGYLEHGVWREI